MLPIRNQLSPPPSPRKTRRSRPGGRSTNLNGRHDPVEADLCVRPRPRTGSPGGRLPPLRHWTGPFRRGGRNTKQSGRAEEDRSYEIGVTEADRSYEIGDRSECIPPQAAPKLLSPIFYLLTEKEAPPAPLFLIPYWKTAPPPW